MELVGPDLEQRPLAWKDPKHRAIGTIPRPFGTYAGELLVCYRDGFDSFLVGLDETTGEKRWEKHWEGLSFAPVPVLHPRPRFAPFTEPLERTVLCNITAYSEDGRPERSGWLDLESREFAWQLRDHGRWSHQVVRGDRRILCGSGLWVLDSKTGDVKAAARIYSPAGKGLRARHFTGDAVWAGAPGTHAFVADLTTLQIQGQFSAKPKLEIERLDEERWGNFRRLGR